MVGYCSLDSRKTVNQIDVEIKNVGLSSILLSCSVLISPFFCLGFSGLIRWPLHLKTHSASFDSIEITAQNLMVRNR